MFAVKIIMLPRKRASLFPRLQFSSSFERRLLLLADTLRPCHP